MKENEKKKEKGEISDDTAAAVAAGIFLHRSGPGSRVVLYHEGRYDEGYWGRAARAGFAANVPHVTRRS